MNILENKVALITGASKGLGEIEAIELAKAGAAVTVLSRTYEDVRAVAERITDAGGRALPFACDVSQRDQVRQVVEETVKAFGTVDILVNNAQLIPPPHALEEWTEEEHRFCWESGYLGTLNFMLECFPYMKQHGGKIINTASGAGHGYLFGMSGYGAAKEAIRSLTRSAAKEWGQYQICVNAISPSALTPGALECMDPEMEASIMEMFALKRWSDPVEEIGKVVVFLASAQASFMTGNTISLDGGAAMVV